MIANLHADRRREPRLRYAWDAHLYIADRRPGVLSRMVDLNSEGAALLLENSQGPPPGQVVELRLTYPVVIDGQFDIAHNHLYGEVLRDEQYNTSLRRVVVRFNERLDTAPAVGNEYLCQ